MDVRDPPDANLPAPYLGTARKGVAVDTASGQKTSVRAFANSKYTKK